MKKTIVLILFTAVITRILAQQPDTGIGSSDIQQDFLEKFLKNHPVNESININNLFASSINSQAKFFHSLTNGDKVYLMPQDKMHCIVSK